MLSEELPLRYEARGAVRDAIRRRRWA